MKFDEVSKGRYIYERRQSNGILQLLTLNKETKKFEKFEAPLFYVTPVMNYIGEYQLVETSDKPM